MRILITGIAGFVGRNLVRYIRSHLTDATIIGIDNLSEDPHSFYNYGLDSLVDIFINRDVVEVLKISSFVDTFLRFDLVIHCAAVVRGKEHQISRPFAISRNLVIDQTVISAVNNGLADELIYFSSCAAYGLCLQNDIHPVPNYESQLSLDAYNEGVFIPEGIYGWAKIAGEYLCGMLPSSKKVTVLRPFGGYGTDQSLTYPFPAILSRVKRGDNPVVVFGSGKQIRDWIHIKDICRLAFEAHKKNVGRLTLNLGTGIGLSFFDLVALMAKQLGRNVEVAPALNKPEGVAFRVADTLKMQAHNLHAEIPISTGIFQAIEGTL